MVKLWRRSYRRKLCHARRLPGVHLGVYHSHGLDPLSPGADVVLWPLMRVYHRATTNCPADRVYPSQLYPRIPICVRKRSCCRKSAEGTIQDRALHQGCMWRKAMIQESTVLEAE